MSLENSEHMVHTNMCLCAMHEEAISQRSPEDLHRPVARPRDVMLGVKVRTPASALAVRLR